MMPVIIDYRRGVIDKKFYPILFLLILMLSFVVVGCSKKEKNQMEYNNNVFTKNINENLVEIDYWNGDEKIVISNGVDIQNIYKSLASLKLSEASPGNAIKYGHIIIDLVLNDETVSFGLLSGEVIINNTRYYTNNNIVDSIRDIVLQNE